MEERNMHQITTTGSCGLVLDTDGSSVESGKTTPSHSSLNRNPEFTGHFILKRYHVDDDGHVCLTPSLPLSELAGSIEILTAELESLLKKAKQRLLESARAV
jgi:hypothetical protein